MKHFLLAVTAAAIALTSAAVIAPVTVYAENPIIQTSFTPDPAPVIFGDELWVFTGRDRNADNDFYYMTGWQAFSTTDMKNWTNHGCFLEDDDFSWCNENDAWASQCIERNGKYYFYFTTTNKSGGGRAVGVAVAENPEGPYKDVLGKPLCGPNWDYIDPTVMIDDDGQAWLMFGNPKCYYVKLKEDMITLDGEIKNFDMTEQAFGKGKNGSAYGEGPWICKHDSTYYLVYAGFYESDGGESICYSYGPSVTGPWTFGGKITPESNCFTTHGGTIDYKDHSYLFYHMNGLQGGGSFKRSAAVEEFTYNPDGTIPMVKPTKDGPDQIESFNPYKKVEAETGSWFSGLEVEPAGNGSQAVAMVNDGDYIKVSGVDFGSGAETFTVSASSDGSGGKIEIHLDSLDGKLVGAASISPTGGWQKWEESSCDISGAEGEHDVYFKFTGESGFLFNLDWWQFGSSSYVEVPDEPENSDYIFNSTFEKGTDSWSGRGSAKVAVKSGASYNGSKALLVSDRNAEWNGTTKKLDSSKFKGGTAYSFSVNTMCPKEDTQTTFYMKLQYTDPDDEVQYMTIAEGTANGGDWIQLTNESFKLPANATDMYVYVETATGKSDFYIDEAIAAVEGTVIEGAGKSKMFMLGDINSDGTFSVLDLSAAKHGLLKGFAGKSAEAAADVDKSGTFDAVDVKLIKEYLFGMIDRFPDNSPVKEPEKSDFNYEANLAYHEAPGNYYEPGSKAGKVINESYTGVNGANKLNVYLPYGYDESKKYNIFYLMHGGGENENTIFSNDVKINYMLDHMIENGDIEPMIVVTPTFNKCSAETVYTEMKESIVPFVEGKYSTYAENTTPAGLEASRMHRAYGGFSMGGGSTWNVLINDIDYFAYYMPLSGHCWGGAGAVADAISNSKYKDSTYIMAATGTEDIAYGNLKPQIEEMKKMTNVFTYTSDFSKGNLYFIEAKDNVHWWGVVRHYVYDGLPYFFHE